MLLEHGGKLIATASKYGIPVEQWVDLSTGVSPVSYPVPHIEPDVWRRLPQEQDGLVEIACAYYSVSNLLPVSGSQAAIKALPYLRPKSRVGLVHPSYNEHAHAWRQCGHEIVTVDFENLEAACKNVDVLVVCNPNNPTGAHSTSQRLHNCLTHLAQRGGWLVVDEAFIDYDPSESMTKFCDSDGLIVLRSLGKFFGLAGARVGFVCAGTEILGPMANHLGPWTIAGPSRLVASSALSDRVWQFQQRKFLQESSERLAELLQRFRLRPTGSTSYFQWVVHPHADIIHVKLAENAILTRYFSSPSSVRFGLPCSDAQWAKLEQALAVANIP